LQIPTCPPVCGNRNAPATSARASGPLDDAGRLQITLSGAPARVVTEQAPLAWQVVHGRRVPVAARFVLGSDGTLSFAVDGYDRAWLLVIDPLLSYSTFLGGVGGDSIAAVALDPAGNICVTGFTYSPDFPLQNPLQPTLGGSIDVFVTKLNASGATLVYSTYLGGIHTDDGMDIAVDGWGNAYVDGVTLSPDFPLASPLQPVMHSDQDAFVAKLDPAGTALVYSTFLGGSSDDTGHGIAVDGAGVATVSGGTNSLDFPLQDPLQSTLGGGVDAMVAQIAADGNALLFSTYLGGNVSGDESYDMALDPAGNIYVVGWTWSSDFPMSGPSFQPVFGGRYDGFIAKISRDVPAAARVVEITAQPAGGDTTSAWWLVALLVVAGLAGATQVRRGRREPG
jgi:hypothetical protein